jgi:phosphoglycolate phosphatase
MTPRLILFDLDGTLVNTGGAGLRAFDRSMEEEFGPGMTLDTITPAGMTDTAIFREIFSHNRGRSPVKTEEERLFVRYLKYLEEEIAVSEGFRVLPGVREILEELADDNRFLVGLGTGNLETGARIKLERPALNGYFSFGGFGSDSSDRPELLRQGVKKGLEAAGRTGESGVVIVIGDTPRDVSAGKAIGARTLAVASGPYSRTELQKSEPDLAVDDLCDSTALAAWFLS